MFDDDMALLLKNVLEGLHQRSPLVVWNTINMQRFSRQEEAQCTCLFVLFRLLLLSVYTVNLLPLIPDVSMQ
jgi:hypothetical protein